MLTAIPSSRSNNFRSPPRLFLEMPYLVHLLSSSESMDINSLASLDFGSTSSNPSINLKYSGPSLSSSDFSLSAERFERLGIILLRGRFDLIFELGKIAIGLRFHCIAGDDLDDVLSICPCWLRYLWLRTTLLRVSKRRYCKSGNGGNQL